MGKGPAVLALVNISTPWSEADPGMPFQEWLRSVTGGTWPRALPEDDPAAWGSQQEEWVRAMSGRSGVSGLLKPNKALHEDARVDPQPSGGDTVKVVLRPVRCTDVDQLPERGRRGRSCFAIISTPGAWSRMRPRAWSESAACRVTWPTNSMIERTIVNYASTWH